MIVQLKSHQSKLVLLGVLLLAAALRFYQLDTLQTEVYGDIEIVNRFVEEILTGQRPFKFVLSAGPLYHYLIAPLVEFLGPSYLTLKIASSFVGLASLLAIYWMAKQIVSQEAALLTAFITAVSSWHLIFSRLGNSQILIPLEVALTLGLAFKALRQNSQKHWLWAILVSATGLYTYPQTFVLPVVVLGLQLLSNPGGLRILGKSLVVLFLAALPFLYLVSQDPQNFLGQGYIGGHFLREEQTLNQAAPIFFANLKKGLLMLHFKGDLGFRSNPLGLPHLDRASGVFFLAGIGIFWRFVDKKILGYLGIAYLILLLPSVLVLAQPQEVPSASRAIGVTPIVYLLTGSGLNWFYEKLKQFRLPGLAQAGLGLALLLVLYLNCQRYFVNYIQNLPNPAGRTILTSPLKG